MGMLDVKCSGSVLQQLRSLPNDLQHWNPKGHCSNAVGLILYLLPETFLVSINKLLQLSLQRLSKMLLTLLHHTAE